MSRSRITVEWGFGRIKTLWRILGNKASALKFRPAPRVLSDAEILSFWELWIYSEHFGFDITYALLMEDKGAEEGEAHCNNNNANGT